MQNTAKQCLLCYRNVCFNSCIISEIEHEINTVVGIALLAIVFIYFISFSEEP